MEKIRHKAVALISGGLDSMLAAKMILDQGIHVEGLNFYTGFCHTGHTSAIRQNDKRKLKRNDALWVAEQLNIKLHIIDVVDEYKAVLTKPKYGYGQHLNPCLDCKVFMVKKAKAWMEEHGFDFIITGEVIGQRPKSQRRQTMPIVEKQSGAKDRLLRPLCAQHFPLTLAEREGWVDRGKLLAIHGRGRSAQITLAQSYGLNDYAQPAGGCCVLTDMNYARKLKDFWQSRGDTHYEIDDIILLKVGRHLRPKPHFKLIIGREKGENQFLEGYRKRFMHMRILSHEGPLVLVDGKPEKEDIQLAAQISARFSAGRDASSVQVEVTPLDGKAQIFSLPPLSPEAIPQGWYL